MGIEGAEAYAREHGLGLFIVDDEGRTRIVPGPEDAPSGSSPPTTRAARATQGPAGTALRSYSSMKLFTAG